MEVTHKNSSILVPIRLWTYRNSNLFRIELPSKTLTTNTEWKFDHQLSSIPEWNIYSYHSSTIFYGMNPNIISPLPRGTLIINVHQNPVAPFNTTFIDIAEHQSINASNNIDKIIFYTYFIPKTLPIYVCLSLSMYNDIITNLFIQPDIKNPSQRKMAQGQYSNYVFFLMTEYHEYWKGTSENLCIPCSSSEKNKYNTLKECQTEVYPKIKNRHIWVENSNDPLWSYMQWWNKLTPEQQIRSLLN